MIHGMNGRTLLFFVAPLTLWSSLAPSASTSAQTGIGLQFTPTVKVFVYGFPGLSPTVLQGAEAEATRLLRHLPIRLEYVDCTMRVLPVWCSTPQMPIDLVIRFLPKALPQVSAKTLGIAGSSAEYATAFLFYDRLLALRTQKRSLPVILGRVMAHEIVHLLLPWEGHAQMGLMRAQWSVDDLQVSSTACLGLSPRSVQLLHREALRRGRVATRVREQ